MKQEAVENFLNLPGIAGVALMDGRSRPYFCGVDQTLNFQQKEALAQGILQVVETIPEGFESFEFQFTGHQVHIYKLKHGIILLVLTRNDLVYSDYLKTIKSLKAALQEDIANAIATFRLLAGNVTLASTKYRKAGTAAAPTQAEPVAPQPPVVPAPPSVTESNVSGNTIAASSAPSKTETPTPVPVNASLKEAITALNLLSQFTTQYLGTHVIANYWKSSRPAQDWLGNFQVDRSAQFSFSGTLPAGLQHPLSPEEQQWIREWVAAFIKRCSQVIRDFAAIVQQRVLTDEQKSLLFG